MIRLRRYTKPCNFCWVSGIPSKTHLGSPKGLIFGFSNAHWCIKNQSFHRSSVLWDKRLAFSNWAFHVCSGNYLGSSKNQYVTEKIALFGGIRGFCSDGCTKDPKIGCRNARAVAEAEAALIDYFHITRGLQFTDAEHMSKNSPIFLDGLLRKVEKDEQVGRALTRFLRYHPINEFEPFFESLGLKPSEYISFLPRDLMFLSDNEDLLENYHVLCNYGIACRKIGRIFKEANKVFRYSFGVLGSKLQAYERLGLSKSSIIKIVPSSPQLLIGDVNREFVKLLEKLESTGIEREWIGGTVSENITYDWGRLLMLLQFLSNLGFTDQELGTLIRTHASFVADGSGKTVFLLVGLLAKMGARKKKIFSMLARFPCFPIGTFMKNMLQGVRFLIEIEMDPDDIQNLILEHVEILGTCRLKRSNSILCHLNVGKRRLCRIIKNEPNELKKYVLGLKVDPLPNSGEDERSLVEKKRFLLWLGFVEDSHEMKKALQVFRGKGSELQNRFDFFVKVGLDVKDVSNMMKLAPQILNQKIDVLQSKIDFLVNNLGYPISSLVAFPSYMSYTVERVKLRFLMYNWLKDRGKARPGLALSTVLATSDKIFVKKVANSHPNGLEVWENLKKALCSS